eukprot:evm.model.scf_85EXC.15 EVM.evm.TU.scf_85EXC.15   scf_85EXC:113633-120711(+)
MIRLLRSCPSRCLARPPGIGPGAAHPPRPDHAAGARVGETCAGAGRSWSSGDAAVLRLRAATGVAEQERAAGGAEAGSEEDVQLLATSESPELLRIRHSCAHVMAMAVKQLYPTAQCTIGPAIDYGFYYDFDMDGAVVTEQDLKAIRKEMRKIVGKDLPFICEEVSEAEAIERIEEVGEPYKKEILTDIVGKDANAPITIYHIGQKGQEDHWWDLCSGPHVESTGKIKQDAFDLESLAAEAALVEALESKGWAYVVDNGGGAFYGPKIDVKIQDAIGRKWQCSTVQLDFNLPERFDMSYVDADNAKRRPIMIHRAIFGSIERFFGILVENYAGAFPLWLAPVQCRLLPVTDAFTDFAKAVASQMRDVGIRAEVCDGERIGKLIRNAERAKTPVMCVVGEKEVESGTLSVRTRKDGDLGAMDVPQMITRMKTAVELRRDF